MLDPSFGRELSRVLRNITVISVEVGRLTVTEACWSSPSYSPEDRVAFRAEWHDLMNVLSGVVAASMNGRLPDAENRALRDLALHTIKAIPIMERLGLTLPDRASLEEIAGASARA